MFVVFDADGIIAYFDPDDDNYIRAQTIFQKLLEEKAFAFFPISAVCEAITVFQKKEPKPKPHLARFLADRFETHLLKLQTPTEKMVLEAIETYTENNMAYSKGNTIFDAIIAAIATQYHADAIFSFDHWFSQEGYMLVEEYFKKKSA